MINGIEIFENVANLPSVLINQSEGDGEKERCCIGAHLARAMKLEDKHYLAGADAWADAMGGNRAHAILLLRQAGAPQHPFGGVSWRTAPSVVCERLKQIESLPDLTRADLRYANLRRANLRDADLTRTDLTHADLRHADLTRADLTHADLTRADLSQADLTRANLRDADLRHADLPLANLTHANLRDADLRHANLRDADLRDTDLRDTDLRDTDLRDAKGVT